MANTDPDRKLPSRCFLGGQLANSDIRRLGWHSARHLTMRLSDAGLHQRRTKPLYPNHRLPPWLTEDATRDRSNRLLDFVATQLLERGDQRRSDAGMLEEPLGANICRR